MKSSNRQRSVMFGSGDAAPVWVVKSHMRTSCADDLEIDAFQSFDNFFGF